MADQAHAETANPSAPGWYVPHDGNRERFVMRAGSSPLRLTAYQGQLRLLEAHSGLLIGPTDRRLPFAGIYVSNLRGTFYHRAGAMAGDFSPGATVRLVREPDNPHDPNAVAVYAEGVQHLVAYVDRRKAKLLAVLIDSGKTIEALSLRGTAAGTSCEQAAILATSPELMAQLLSPSPPGSPSPRFTVAVDSH